MLQREKKTALLSSVPVPRALLAMGLPTMVGMMISALYNLVDAYFVGGLGESPMGAVAVVFPLGQVVVGLGLLFGNGAAVYIARLLGHGDREAADSAASTALFGSILAGAAFILCTVAFLRPVLILLGATGSILPYALTYGRIYIGSSMFNVFNVTMNNIVTSEGAAKTTMGTMLAGAALNIALGPVFIFVLDMGVAGAAIATAISQAASALVYLFYILRRRSIFSFSVRACRFSREIMAEILKIGVPTMIFQLLTSLSIALINRQARGCGDSVIAGLGAVSRIISMGNLMVFGFIKGFQPIAGYSYGAQNIPRLREAVRTATLWTTGFCAVFGLGMALFPAAVISQFTPGDALFIRAGQAALRANGLTFLLFGFYTIYSSLFLALGRAKEGFFLGVCRQGICFFPVILLLPQVWGLNGILYAQPIADVISAAIAAYMAAGLHRELSPPA